MHGRTTSSPSCAQPAGTVHKNGTGGYTWSTAVRGAQGIRRMEAGELAQRRHINDSVRTGPTTDSLSSCGVAQLHRTRDLLTFKMPHASMHACTMMLDLGRLMLVRTEENRDRRQAPPPKERGGALTPVRPTCSLADPGYVIRGRTPPAAAQRCHWRCAVSRHAK